MAIYHALGDPGYFPTPLSLLSVVMDGLIALGKEADDDGAENANSVWNDDIIFNSGIE